MWMLHFTGFLIWHSPHLNALILHWPIIPMFSCIMQIDRQWLYCNILSTHPIYLKSLKNVKMWHFGQFLDHHSVSLYEISCNQFTVTEVTNKFLWLHTNRLNIVIQSLKTSLVTQIVALTVNGYKVWLHNDYQVLVTWDFIECIISVVNCDSKRKFDPNLPLLAYLP